MSGKVRRCDGCGCSDPDGDDCPGVIWSESADRCICHAIAEMDAVAAPERCVVEVGTHPGPFWKDRNSGMVVCSRHRSQYEERSDEFGPFDWERDGEHPCSVLP